MKKAIKGVAEAMQSSVSGVSFAIRFWDDEEFTLGEAPAFTLCFKTKAAASNALANGFMGFGEGYMTGDIEVAGDIRLLLRLGFAAGYTEHAVSLGLKFRILLAYILKQNTLAGSRKNIRHHYDVGNEFYQRLLDPTMSYSCAYYASPENSLEQAQQNKLDLICRKLRLAAGDHILDLGCGWAGLLIHAVQNYGVTGVGITLSQAQYEYGSEKIAQLGLQDRLRVELRDYREIEGRFDKIASIEMIEHVGIRFIPGFFAKIRSLLKPGGLGLVQTSGNDVLRKADPWTDKYIFPGGQVPPLSLLADGVGKNGMSVIDVEEMRLHFERTLRDWLDRLRDNEDWVRETYDDIFLRSYRLYLEVSMSSFRYGDNRLFQLLFSNGLSEEIPLTRSDLYCH